MGMKGKLITFEGSEGSGKSTQIDLAQRYLEAKGMDVLFLREPGGVMISEKIRNILLDTATVGMSDECETLLYMAARAQLVEEVIIPALKDGKVILCDRFLDSTVAYQGYGNGINIAKIKRIGAFATQGYAPDLTFLFDLDVHEGLARINRPKDRIENRNIDYHNRVKKGYLAIAKLEPSRVKVINATKSKDEIQSIVKKHLNRLLNLKAS
jgi:dTMP kinase